MSMKYFTKEQLQNLSDEQLAEYAASMTKYQIDILAIMDDWVDAYNLASDEYDRRKPYKAVVEGNDIKH